MVLGYKSFDFGCNLVQEQIIQKFNKFLGGKGVYKCVIG